MCEIKKSTLGRLPAYLEFLYGIKDKRETISTSAIADALSFGSVQVKKDLSSVCKKGKPKIGYVTEELKISATATKVLNHMNACLKGNSVKLKITANVETKSA